MERKGLVLAHEWEIIVREFVALVGYFFHHHLEGLGIVFHTLGLKRQ